jgi:hypothetical protein
VSKYLLRGVASNTSSRYNSGGTGQIWNKI